VGLENSAKYGELALRLQPRSTQVTNLNTFSDTILVVERVHLMPTAGLCLGQVPRSEARLRFRAPQVVDLRVIVNQAGSHRLGGRFPAGVPSPRSHGRKSAVHAPRVARLVARSVRSVADKHEFAVLRGAAQRHRAEPHQTAVLRTSRCSGEQYLYLGDELLHPAGAEAGLAVRIDFAEEPNCRTSRRDQSVEVAGSIKEPAVWIR
jgi:hypothetical protein